MTALASSLKRIWSAKNRVPHPNSWGTTGSLCPATEETFTIGQLMERFSELIALAQRTAPTIVVVALSIFR